MYSAGGPTVPMTSEERTASLQRTVLIIQRFSLTTYSDKSALLERLESDGQI